MCKEIKGSRLVASSDFNDNDICQYISVNIGEVLDYIKNPEEYGDNSEPAYITIGYYERGKTGMSSMEFPNLDILIYISGAITTYNDIALVRHFGNDPGKLYDLYNEIVPLLNAASSLVDHEHLFSAVSDTIFDILKGCVHQIDAPKNNVVTINPRFVDLKYESTFLGFVRQWSGKVYNYKLIDLKNELRKDAPLLWLHMVTVGTDVEFLVYPDGSLIVHDFPTWLHFDDISEFGGVRILEFCKECNRQYKLADGDLTKDGVYDGYEDIVKKLLHDLQYREL